MFAIWQGDQIRYWDLTQKLLRRDGTQEMVPFLGAGVSVSDRDDVVAKPAPTFPDDATMDKIAELLKLDGVARLYLEYATRMAARMQAWEQANGPLPTREELVKRLLDATYPPSAWELAELFSQIAAYHSFMDRALVALDKADLVSQGRRAGEKHRLLPMLKLAALATDLASAADPLTSISGYYESTGERKDLWKILFDIISGKHTPTGTHRLIAEAAARHLAAQNAEDYLIITTNYDALQEQALDEKELPYVVLWRKRSDGLIHSRIENVTESERADFARRNLPRAPQNLILHKNRAMAIVYKMHGCLYSQLTDQDDGLVVTDSDYVDFIAKAGGMPAHVGSLLGAKQLLFLGYSFGDWNVRSIYETAIGRAGKTEAQDYAVTRSLSRFEEMYFKKRNIIIVMTDLKTFSAEMSKEAAKP